MKRKTPSRMTLSGASLSVELLDPCLIYILRLLHSADEEALFIYSVLQTVLFFLKKEIKTYKYVRLIFFIAKKTLYLQTKNNYCTKMSDYIIHNIDLIVSRQYSFDELIEEEKPVNSYPNYYLGKVIGSKGNELQLKRTRRGVGEEHVPNCVLRNDNGIALLRIHNKENLTFFDLPANAAKKTDDCVGVPKSSYPYGYVVIDYRDDRCQVAIEKTSAWDSNTTTIRNSLENFFNTTLSNRLSIETRLIEKRISTEYEKFIDQRTIDHGDIIESFTFQYVNLSKKPTSRIPKELTEQMELHSKLLEIYDAIEGSTTWKLGANPDKAKLKQLSSVVTMCADNSFELITHFRDYGDYACNESILAKYPMNDIVISNFKDCTIPDTVNDDFDLKCWLDEVFKKIKGEKDEEEIPTKPM